MSSEAEWKTRKQRIDPRLDHLGWPRGHAGTPGIHRFEEYETDHGPADYALCQGAQVLGVIEAKKLSLGPQNVLTQAERYSRGCSTNAFRFGDFRVPFLYSTNGEVIWFRDVRHPLNLSRRVVDFHTPDALRQLLSFDLDHSCRWFVENPNDHPRLRPYQIEANAAIEQALADRKRQMLVAMATGTGKTFTIVNQVYRLMKSGVGKRILFLVDRRALAAQAVRAFASFEPEPGHKFNQIYEVYHNRFQREDFDADERFDPRLIPQNYLEKPPSGAAFVYVCTIQSMILYLLGPEAAVFLGEEIVDRDVQKLDIPIHAFDVIVADECHRGYTSGELSAWRATLDHFDAIKIGLTATPAAHTKAYFNEVVYRYPYERAVREGHLVDYDVVAVRSQVRLEGVFLKEGEEVGMVDPTSGQVRMDLLEDERPFDATQVEQQVTVPESNRMILEELKKYALEHEERHGRFPKTLVFAVNDLPQTSHADQLVRIARDVFGRGESFVGKITGRVDRPLQRIREFRNRPQPSIVVSVDMLTTGVDIPDLEFIVFLRPVKSRILFEQMLGRGTRKGEAFPDKSHFTVFDCFDGTLLEYFRNTTAITAEPPDRPSRTIVQIIEDIWANQDRAYNINLLAKRLQRIDKEVSAEGRIAFAAFIPQGDVAAYARALPDRLRDAFVPSMELLRNPDFQKLLLNPPRPPRTFVIAYEAQDEVSSEWRARDAAGNEYKPEDYLEAFARFVAEKQDEVDAIRILLDRPRDWSPTALAELEQSLKTSTLLFTREQLERAHKLRFQKLVDFISMVKHAAREAEPLYTPEERVARAITAVTAGRQLTPPQQEWLGRIHDHLVQNLSIGREDFEDILLLSRAGGWGRANREFDGALAALLNELNEAIAA